MGTAVDESSLDLGEAHLEKASLDLRQVEEVVDEESQADAVAGGEIEEAALVGGRVPRRDRACGNLGGTISAEGRPMLGQMMDVPLTLPLVLERARKLFPGKELVSRIGAGLVRSTYGEVAARVGRLANALAALGVGRGDRVATFAWNDHRHIELYFAVPGMGAVLHPLNLRLPDDQISYIAGHAEDRVVLVDPTLLPAIERLAPALPSVEHYVVLADRVPPGTALTPVHAYEELLAAQPVEHPWPALEEDEAAAMCYTSGTTGHPKGVVYSHRSLVLHTLGLTMTDSLGISERDVFLPVVPMFHALAWGTPYACTLLGSQLVLPGPHLKPRDLAELIQETRVTVAAGVPTLWLGLLQLLDQERFDVGSLRTLIVGGSAAPRGMIEGFSERHGIEVLHAWGMTETSPLGTVSRAKSHQLGLPREERLTLAAKQGLPVPLVDLRAVDESGREVPWDGETFGELQVRGPWVAGSYYRDDRSAASFLDGWFRTGDVVTIDPEGFILIVDRTKDLIKSGGEWISSQELENSLMAHPAVLEAAVVAVPHPKWLERPLACVVAKPGAEVTREGLLAHLGARFPRLYLPDDVVFLDEVPKTSVGKFDKRELRRRFADHPLPETP